MPLHVHVLDPSDPSAIHYFPAIARIHLAAWLTVPLMKAIYYGPPDAYGGYLAGMLERHTKAFREEQNCRFAIVLDDTLPEDEEVIVGASSTRGPTESESRDEESPRPRKGKAIAAMKYYFVNVNGNGNVNANANGPPSSTTTTSVTAPSPPPTTSSTESRTWPAYSHSSLASDFWSHLVEARALLTAKLGPHVLVDNLYTHPDHHRRGAGGMLMRHACSEADARGLPSMLEASPKGIRVYESVGFRRFGEAGNDGNGVIWVDLERWEGGKDRGVEFTVERLNKDPAREGRGWYAQVLMVRPVYSGGSAGASASTSTGS
jgi:GNAT superfamily N-acetyltransferase